MASIICQGLQLRGKCMNLNITVWMATPMEMNTML